MPEREPASVPKNSSNNRARNGTPGIGNAIGGALAGAFLSGLLAGAGNALGNALAGATGENAQSGARWQPYKIEVKQEGGKTFFRNLEFPSESRKGKWQVSSRNLEQLREFYGTDAVFPPPAAPANELNPTSTTNNSTPATQLPNPGEVPLDTRLIYLADPDSSSVVYSFTSQQNLQSALVDGFIIKKDGKKTSASSDKVTPDDVNQYVEFFGIPSLMNYNAYINLQGAGGKFGNRYLIDRENQPKWYEVTGQGNKSSAGSGSPIGPMGELTVKGLVDWCQQKENLKFPYRYQDFVFLKWWKKIPLNYMITLRRYTFPTNDSVGSAEEEKGKVKPAKLLPAATAITFLGEDPGNKISTILGPIDAGLKWKEVKADVWEVSFSGSAKSADSPTPGLAKALGFLTGGADAAQPEPGGPPPDPYNNGPYSNKIIGPVNVIDSTQARDRGLTFKQEFSLVFEYSARSIGGINSKAALLDILGNLMILTYNEAAFWGGANRYMPQAAQGELDPFLGGPAGRQAWLQGNPDKFFKALSDQFTGALKNVGDAFSKFLDDPISGLKSLATGAASSYMKLNTSGGKGFMQGIHSLLTGAPVGEWHLTVGNPMNPMMMVGNLVCTNIKIEFNDELGPDDFPTELKATISLSHGMPRDRAGIESMFNKGRGRMYSLPKGYDKNFSSSNQSAAALGFPPGENDPYGRIKGATKASNGQRTGAGGVNGGSTPDRPKGSNPLLGDPGSVDGIFGYFKQSTTPKVASTLNAVYSHGVKFIDRA